MHAAPSTSSIIGAQWASECTAFPETLSEEALAHVVSSETRRAYRRSDALEQRRALMEARAEFLGREEGPNVVAALRMGHPGNCAPHKRELVRGANEAAEAALLATAFPDQPQP